MKDVSLVYSGYICVCLCVLFMQHMLNLILLKLLTPPLCSIGAQCWAQHLHCPNSLTLVYSA